MTDRVFLGSDHAGFALKKRIIDSLCARGISIEDVGCHDEAPCDYPVYGRALCARVLEQTGSKGILICGTGLGMSMTANRYRGIRAALCSNEFLARMSRAHNDSNVLVLGGRVLGPDLALAIMTAWLDTPFEGGRHLRRIALMDDTQ